MTDPLPDLVRRAEDLEDELAEVRSVVRVCLRATLALVTASAGAAVLYTEGFLGSPRAAEVLATCALAMLVGTGVAKVWTRSETQRLERELRQLFSHEDRGASSARSGHRRGNA